MTNIALDTTRPWRVGYQPPLHLREAARDAQRPSLLRSIGTAVADVSMGVTACLITSAAWRAGVATGGIATAAVLPALAPVQRGLENLVHEASHLNWSRTRWLNDLAANLLAAAPVAGRVEAFRATHAIHHQRLGSDIDPDKRRYESLGLTNVDRSSPMRLAADLMRKFPGYWCASMQSIVGDRRALLGGVAFHASVWSIAAHFVGPQLALAAAVYWVVAMVSTLPLLRLIAEAGEHDYTAPDAFSGTISNLGRLHRVVLHRHADGLHTLHHRFPNVPHHQLRELHRQLLRDDIYRCRIPIRTRLAQEPTKRAFAAPTETTR